MAKGDATSTGGQAGAISGAGYNPSFTGMNRFNSGMNQFGQGGYGGYQTQGGNMGPGTQDMYGQMGQMGIGPSYQAMNRLPSTPTGNDMGLGDNIPSIMQGAGVLRPGGPMYPNTNPPQGTPGSISPSNNILALLAQMFGGGMGMMQGQQQMQQQPQFRNQRYSTGPNYREQ